MDKRYGRMLNRTISLVIMILCAWGAHAELLHSSSPDTFEPGEREVSDGDLKAYEELRFQKLRDWKKKFQKKN